MPPSVRFWERKVYWAPVLLLVSALRQGRHPAVTMERLKAICGVWRSTVARWQSYFQELFPQTIGYRRLRGRLMPPVNPDQFPGALLARFHQRFGEPESALVICLLTLALGP